jgi:hypothetical protein
MGRTKLPEQVALWALRKEKEGRERPEEQRQRERERERELADSSSF